MDTRIVAELAPRGVLRAGINLANMLLVTGRGPNGEPQGVAPDMAAEIARELGVPVQYIPHAGPGELIDAATQDAWDIGLVAAEPARMEWVAFTAPYVELNATYLVAGNSPLTAIEQVDQPGTRIAVARRTAYDLWLERNLKHAERVLFEGLAATRDQFGAQHLDALAGLEAGLLEDMKHIPGSRLLPGRFTAVQQAIGTPRKHEAGIAFLSDFVARATSGGLVQSLIDRHKVRGLSVA